MLRSAAAFVVLIVILLTAFYSAEHSFSPVFQACANEHRVGDRNLPADDDVIDRSPVNLRDRLVASLLRPATRLAVAPLPRLPISWQRRWLRLLTRLLPAERGTDTVGVVRGGVKGEWVRPAGAVMDDGRGAAILYLHGGCYCIGAPAMDRALTSRLARATGLPVFAADYRLAPEHPYPAAVDDAIAAYQSLL
jgi:alpha/beta hydrolase fold